MTLSSVAADAADSRHEPMEKEQITLDLTTTLISAPKTSMTVEAFNTMLTKSLGTTEGNMDNRDSIYEQGRDIVLTEWLLKGSVSRLPILHIRGK